MVFFSIFLWVYECGSVTLFPVCGRVRSKACYCVLSYFNCMLQVLLSVTHVKIHICIEAQSRTTDLKRDPSCGRKGWNGVDGSLHQIEPAAINRALWTGLRECFGTVGCGIFTEACNRNFIKTDRQRMKKIHIISPPSTVTACVIQHTCFRKKDRVVLLLDHFWRNNSQHLDTYVCLAFSPCVWGFYENSDLEGSMNDSLVSVRAWACACA